MNGVRVGMISSSYPRNQNDFAGVFVRSLAESLVDLGHEVHMLAAHDPEVRANAVGPKVRMHYFPYAWPRRLHVLGYGRSLKSDVKLRKLAYAMIPAYLASATWQFMSLAKRQRFDVLHAHWVIPTGPVAAVVAKALGIPLVISLHGSDVYLLDKNRAARTVAKASLAAARVVTACSDDLRSRTVAAGVPREKIVVLPYGVDAGAFDRSRLDDRSVWDIRKRALGTDGTHIVLGLGRLVQKKGFEYLVRAIPPTVGLHAGVRFIVAGDGDERERLTQLARELGVDRRVAFPGAIPWHLIPYHLAAADVVVVPSIRDTGGNVDGLPNVLLEAMAAGRPIVASAVAGIPAAIRDGYDGFLVREKSPAEIARALDGCLSSPDLRERVGRNARQRVVESFSWPSVAVRMSAIYRAAMDA